MHELMFNAGVKGMSERSELIPFNIIRSPQAYGPEIILGS